MMSKQNSEFCIAKYTTMETNTKNTSSEPSSKEVEKQPNDSGKVHVDEFIRIHDPNTKQVYHEGRA
jgi:hypothetical protein